MLSPSSQLPLRKRVAYLQSSWLRNQPVSHQGPTASRNEFMLLPRFQPSGSNAIRQRSPGRASVYSPSASQQRKVLRCAWASHGQPWKQPPGTASIPGRLRLQRGLRARQSVHKSFCTIQGLKGEALPRGGSPRRQLSSELPGLVTPRGEREQPGGGKPSHAAISLRRYFGITDTRGITTAVSPQSRDGPRSNFPFGCVKRFSSVARLKCNSSAVF